MNNIFENAYIGRPYKTRDGRRAIIVRMFEESVEVSDGKNLWSVYKDGIDYHLLDFNNFDIISEYQEELNEEELDKLAKSIYGNPRTKDSINYGYVEGFKTGYRRKALEYLNNNMNNHGNS